MAIIYADLSITVSREVLPLKSLRADRPLGRSSTTFISYLQNLTPTHLPLEPGPIPMPPPKKVTTRRATTTSMDGHRGARVSPPGVISACGHGFVKLVLSQGPATCSTSARSHFSTAMFSRDHSVLSRGGVSRRPRDWNELQNPRYHHSCHYAVIHSRLSSLGRPIREDSFNILTMLHRH